MPFYEYRCEGCKTRFELIRKVTDRDQPTECPKCGKSGAKREPSRVQAKVVGETPCGAPPSSCAMGEGGFT